jgi:hypothetical protein
MERWNNGIQEEWNDGILEWWNGGGENGIAGKWNGLDGISGCSNFSIIPIFHHSNSYFTSFASAS